LKYLRFLSRPRVGIDIQPHAIYLIQLRKTRRGFLVEQTDGFPLSEDKGRDWEAIRIKLADWTRRFGLAGVSAAVSVPAKLVRMQHLSVPLGMPDELIRAEIQAQVERDFPGMSALSMDYSLLAQKNTGYADIHFVIARLEHISQYIECIQAAGLKLKIIDVDIYALHRMFAASLPPLKQENDVHSLLFFIRGKWILLIADKQEILFHYEEEWTESEVWLQIENRIRAAFPTKIVKTVALYANKNEVASLLSAAECSLPYEVFALKPSIELAEEYFLAGGSVLRDMPIW
jgi:type IV pilus assembly protein PilM